MTTLEHFLRRWSTQLSIAVLAVVAYVPTLLSSPGKMPADTKLYLYLDPGRLVSDSMWTFDGRQFAGWVPHQHITYMWPSGPWYWFWETVGAPDWVAHRLWLGTLFFLAGLGVRWLAREFRIGVPGALIAALAYQLSPYVLPYVSRTSLMLLPWAGLGWIVVLTMRAGARGGWRYPAILALVIATVGSPNATALAMVAPAPVLWLVHAAWRRSITWRRAVATALRIGVLAIGVSMWWITMLMVQGRHGADVLDYSESLEAVSFTSTSSEVLRGLGYWLFYLHEGYAPTTTAAYDYLISTRLIAIGYGLVACCLLGLVITRWAHRRFALLLVAGGMLLAVGVHPLSDPAPLVDWLVSDDESGLALALRSSTRAVPMAALGLALGAGALAAAVRPRRSWIRGLVPVGLVVLIVANMPSLWRQDYVDPALERDEDPPDAWLDAAGDLDDMDPGYRVFQVPGQEFGAYRWGYTVDQPLPGLTERPLITRDLLPLGSPEAMELLYAFDDRFQDGTLESGAIAPVARLFGADVLWVVGDATYERFRTPRPEITAAMFEADPKGLGEPVPYGEPFVSDADVGTYDDQSATSPVVGEPVAPVQLVPVEDALPIIRAKTDTVLLSGGGDGIVDAAAAGLIDGSELIQYSADLGEGDEHVEIADADQIIVTDSNRDRARRWNSSQDSVGFTETGGLDDDLLRVESADSRMPAFDLDDASIQTTAHQEGPVTATATAYGEPFAYRPEDRAVMAIDGDPATAWRVADRTGAIGEQIQLQTDAGIDHVTVTQPAHAERQRHITAIDLRIDGRDPRRVELGEASLNDGQRIDVEPTDGPATVTITVAETASPVDVPGPVLAAVGFAEIDVGLGPTTEVVRPPSDLLGQLDDAADGTPISLLFSRERHDPSDRWRSDPEPALTRGFELPVGLDADLDLTARLDARASDQVLAELLGTGSTVANERAAGAPHAAGWAATDDDPETAWVTPFAYVTGSRLTLDIAGEEPFDDFTLTQPEGDYSTITSLTVTARGGDDDGASWRVPVPPPGADGTSTIQLPVEVSADRLQLTIDGITGDNDANGRVVFDRRYSEPVFLPAAISDISVGARTEPADTIDLGCRDDLLTIDGEPVGIELTGSVQQLLDGEPFDAELCGPLPDALRDGIDAGEHRIESTPGASTGIDIDRVELTTQTAETPTGANQDRAAGRENGSPTTTVLSESRTSTRVRVGPCPEGCWLVNGQGYNSEWAAEFGNGKSLGEPTPVDGGFSGWWVPPNDSPRIVTITWEAQRPVTFGFLASAISIVAALALIVGDRRRRPPPAVAETSPVLTVFGRAVSLRRAIVAAAVGCVAAALLIEPMAALWVGAAGVAVIVTRRPRLAGYVGVGVAAYVGLAVAYIVRRDRPQANGAWLEHIEWLHPYGLTAMILMAMAAFGAIDREPNGRESSGREATHRDRTGEPQPAGGDPAPETTATTT